MQDDPAKRPTKNGKGVVKIIVNVELWGRDNKVPWIWVVDGGSYLEAGAAVKVGLGGCKVGFECPNGKEW